MRETTHGHAHREGSLSARGTRPLGRGDGASALFLIEFGNETGPLPAFSQYFSLVLEHPLKCRSIVEDSIGDGCQQSHDSEYSDYDVLPPRFATFRVHVPVVHFLNHPSGRDCVMSVQGADGFSEVPHVVSEASFHRWRQHLHAWVIWVPSSL